MVHSSATDVTPPVLTWREQFFVTLKTRYANVYAVYHLVSIVLIWSGFWYLADTWAQGQDLWAVAMMPSPGVPLRHGVLLGIGIIMLWSSHQSLKPLITMKSDLPVAVDEHCHRWLKMLAQWQQRFRDPAAFYTLVGIIFCWCGTWGLLWDIPVWPWLRSVFTIGLGVGMLYLDNLSLDQL